ncbi:hypothetical protein ACOYW6_09235 [Parablastomonas sp. CN1-191]
MSGDPFAALVAAALRIAAARRAARALSPERRWRDARLVWPRFARKEP